jgi:phosphoribosylaminoimidazole carboxylase (NCAIR synthetase)
MGYPLMLKARGNSYDGKGNYVVKKEEDAEEAFKQLRFDNQHLDPKSLK